MTSKSSIAQARLRSTIKTDIISCPFTLYSPVDAENTQINSKQDRAEITAMQENMITYLALC